MSAPETEHKFADESGFSLDCATGDVTPWDGIRVFWRYKGERRWRHVVLVPDAALGQTVAILKADVPEIVAALASAPAEKETR
jgi:hypothetical protein